MRVKMTASPLSHLRFPETLHTMEENTIVGAILCCTFQALVGWTLSLILERAFIYLSTLTTSTNAITKHSLAFVPDSAMFESKIMLVKRFKDMSDS